MAFCSQLAKCLRQMWCWPDAGWVGLGPVWNEGRKYSLSLASHLDLSSLMQREQTPLEPQIQPLRALVSSSLNLEGTLYLQNTWSQGYRASTEGTSARLDLPLVYCALRPYFSSQGFSFPISNIAYPICLGHNMTSINTLFP